MFDELAKKYDQRAAQLKDVHCSSHERSAAAQSDGELLTDVVVDPRGEGAEHQAGPRDLPQFSHSGLSKTFMELIGCATASVEKLTNHCCPPMYRMRNLR